MQKLRYLYILREQIIAAKVALGQIRDIMDMLKLTDQIQRTIGWIDNAEIEYLARYFPNGEPPVDSAVDYQPPLFSSQAETQAPEAKAP